MGKWTRRAVIASGSVVGGGLLLGTGWFALAPNRIGLRPEAGKPGVAQLATWLRITPDGEIVVVVPHCEFGQGSQTALAMMLADELDADWARVRVEQAPATPDYANGHILRGFLGGLPGLPKAMDRGFEYLTYRATRLSDFQVTGGSVSVRGTGQFGMRVAGAAGREMLVAAAAARWNVPAAECTTRDSVVTHQKSGRSAGYGELAAEAAKLDTPVHPRQKTPAEFRIIGTSRRRFDLPSKTDGSAIYATDVRPPGLLYAAVRAAPVFGGTLQSVDEQPLAGRRGIRKLVRLSNAVAVVAESTWQAQQGLAALEPQFSDGGNGAVTSASWFAQLAKSLDGPDLKKDFSSGDAAAALELADRTIADQPRDARMRFLKGVILTQSGRNAEAEQVFRALTEDFPELSDPYNNLAVLYAADGRLPAALGALQAALRNDPQHRAALENLGDVHLALAIAAWSQAASGAKGDTTALRRKLRLAREIPAAVTPSKPG